MAGDDERLFVQYSSVIDQRVDLAARLADVVDGGVDCSRIAKIDADGSDVEVGTTKGFRGVFAGVQITRSK